MVAFGLLIVISPQLFGGVFTWTLWTIVGLAVVTASLLWLYPKAVLGRLSPTGKVVAAAVGVTALQLTPVPAFLLGLLSPRRHEMLDHSMELIDGSSPGWLALSLDPGGTQLALLTSVVAFVAYAAAATFVQDGCRRLVLSLIAGSSIAMAIMSALHAAVGLDSVFGLYRPKHAHAYVLAPLMNQNHLAALLAVGPPLCLSLGMQTKRPPERLGWFLGAFLTGVMVPLTASRGGVLGLGVSVVVLVGGMVWLRRRLRRALGRMEWMVGGVAIIGMVAGGVALGGDLIASEVATGDTSKLEIARGALGLAMSYPFLGVGRGAFAVAYLGVEGSGTRFTHAESILPHMSAEWGLPFTIVFVLVVGVALAQAVRRIRRMVALGGIAAFAGLVTHEMVDFATELPAMAAVGGALLAAAVERPRRKTDEARDLRRPVALGVALLAAGVAVFGTPTAAYVAADILAERSESWEPSAELPLELRSALRAHPLEPGLYLLAAHQGLRSGSADTPRWLNQAMVLAPGWAGPHVLAGAWLARAGRSGQAALEFREAENRVPLSTTSALCAWGHESPGRASQVVLESAPSEDADAIRFLERVRGCSPDDPSFREAIDAALLERDPHHPGAIRRQAAHVDTAGERVALLQAALARNSEDVALRVELAQVLLGSGELDRAAEVVGELSPGEDSRVVRLRARIALAREDEAAFADAMLTLRGRAAGSGGELANVHRFEGRQREQAGDLSLALAAFERAAALDPTEEGYVAVAQLAERLGLEVRAERAWAEACEWFQTPRACRRRERTP